MLKLGFTKHRYLNIIPVLIEHHVGTSTLGGYLVVSWFLLSVVLMIAVDRLIYNGINPYMEIGKKNAVFRWSIYWFIVFGVVFTIYGEQADFIYAGF